MSHQTPVSLQYAYWAEANSWCLGHVILAANVNSIPSPPPWSQAIMRVDGLWEKRMWQPIPKKTNTHIVDLGLLGEFRDKLQAVKDAMSDPFHEISTIIHFSSIQYPKIAYAWAFEALDQLKKEFGSWCNFVKVIRALQHCLLELIAFSDWWNDVCIGEGYQALCHVPTCGAIFKDEDSFTDHAQ
ncbi:hypothetical protein BJV74DRAFT_889515 [Russula compacta]|nr:hypothetical protein BJV74DRAFT_889515 [Russula compacta]